MKKTLSLVLSSMLLVAMVFTLTSCLASILGPSWDPDKAAAALEENGYIVTNISDSKDYADSKAVVTGTKIRLSSDPFEMIVIIYYDDVEKAKEHYDDVKENFEKESDEESDWVFKRVGSMVYFGTKDAVEAAR